MPRRASCVSQIIQKRRERVPVLVVWQDLAHAGATRGIARFIGQHPTCPHKAPACPISSQTARLRIRSARFGSSGTRMGFWEAMLVLHEKIFDPTEPLVCSRSSKTLRAGARPPRVGGSGTRRCSAMHCSFYMKTKD